MDPTEVSLRPPNLLLLQQPGLLDHCLRHKFEGVAPCFLVTNLWPSHRYCPLQRKSSLLSSPEGVISTVFSWGSLSSREGVIFTFFSRGSHLYRLLQRELTLFSWWSKPSTVISWSTYLAPKNFYTPKKQSVPPPSMSCLPSRSPFLFDLCKCFHKLQRELVQLSTSRSFPSFPIWSFLDNYRL
jgi:hypothetical protein